MRQPTWYDAFIWLGFTVIGFLFPIFVGIFTRAATGGDINLGWIAGGGQFAVLSAALLMTTFYFVSRPGSFSRIQFTEWFVLASIIGLIAGVAMYALATLKASGVEIDSRYYEWPSIGLFALALTVAFIAVGLDRTREINEPQFLARGIQAGRIRIEEEFDSTS